MRRTWSDADLKRLTELYPARPTAEVARTLDRSVVSVYGTAFRLGLSKSQDFLSSPESGRLRKGETRPGSQGTQFPKGNVPKNKGLRRPGWHSGRMKETQFKKGSRSGVAAKNWVPVGSMLRDSDGYLRIKIREAVHGVEATGFGNTKVWPLFSRHIWEQHHGPIPPKHMVAFKDRDRQNCAIENLELISMAENARRNRMWTRLPRELAEAIHLGGVLKRRLRELDGKKNKISDLRDHLFGTLEALKDPDKPMDLERARVISDVAQTIINTAKVEVDLVKVVGDVLPGSRFFDLPEDRELPNKIARVVDERRRLS